MPQDYPAFLATAQPAVALAPQLWQQFLASLQPLLDRLDAQVDRRLVRTFAVTIATILMWRSSMACS